MLLVLVACDRPASGLELRLGTTTTVHDTGLMDSLEAGFKAAHPNIRFATIAAGTGEILQVARLGDVDITLTHDPAAESTFVAQGIGRYRREIMWNDFVLAGPANDPARIRGMTDATAALRKIADAKSTFVSRADDSGTHRRELALWRTAAVDSAQRIADWYLEAGAGMGETLRLANARSAYVMTDRGTLTALERELDLRVVVEGDARLLNRYGLMPIANSRHAAEADSFAAWITGAAGQRIIREYGVKQFGRPLFHLPR